MSHLVKFLFIIHCYFKRCKFSPYVVNYYVYPNSEQVKFERVYIWYIHDWQVHGIGWPPCSLILPWHCDAMSTPN